LYKKGDISDLLLSIPTFSSKERRAHLQACTHKENNINVLFQSIFLLPIYYSLPEPVQGITMLRLGGWDSGFTILVKLGHGLQAGEAAVGYCQQLLLAKLK